MQIQKFTLGDLRSNCYVVFNETNAFIIDPGYENDIVSKFIENHGLDVDFIYLTHGHYDHVGGVKQLKDMYQCRVYAPKKDIFWTKDYALNKLGYEIPVDQYIEEPYAIFWQDLDLQVFETPGHSEGGTILFIPEIDVLFSGDTLFYHTVGRTDIPYANSEVLVESIKKIYKLIPDQTRVYPGHGRATTIIEEKKNNPFVRD